MTPQELKDILISNGYPSRVQGKEVKVEECWFCGNTRWNLELNPAMGVYHCWTCRESGRLDALLQRTLGGTWQIAVTYDGAGSPTSATPTASEASLGYKPASQMGSAVRYLQGRGISPQVADAYGLGVATARESLLFGRIVIPVRDFWSAELVGWVGRAYTGQKPKYLADFPSSRIFGWRQRSWSTPCVMVEGPMDGIPAHRAGFHAAVLGGTASGEGQAFAEFVGRLPPQTPLILMLDGDAAAIANRLYWAALPIHPLLKKIDLPEGVDPGQLLPGVVKKLVERAL